MGFRRENFFQIFFALSRPSPRPPPPKKKQYVVFSIFSPFHGISKIIFFSNLFLRLSASERSLRSMSSGLLLGGRLRFSSSSVPVTSVVCRPMFSGDRGWVSCPSVFTLFPVSPWLSVLAFLLPMPFLCSVSSLSRSHLWSHVSTSAHPPSFCFLSVCTHAH